MFISDFDYDLPSELIAQTPLPERDDSRMMVVFRKEGKILHSRFKEFPNYLNKGDLLVLNDAKVIPAKIWGKKDGKDIEFLFIKEKKKGVWDVLCRPAKRARLGDRIEFASGFEAEVAALGEEGLRTLRFSKPDVLGNLEKAGFAPLPPYIKREKGQAALRSQDLERYQTVFAEREGAIAAPTAGLHFTPRLLDEILDKGAGIVRVTLDVGLATFQPVRVERLEEHKMLEESYEIPEIAAAAIHRAKMEKRPVVAVGTTVVRTLESAARSAENYSGGKKTSNRERGEEGFPRVSPEGPAILIQAGPGATSLFIHPGHKFKIVDRLLTNFHLPKSTLLMLVAAFAGRDLILAAYREAVGERYRFFSYGDCMLIL